MNQMLIPHIDTFLNVPLLLMLCNLNFPSIFNKQHDLFLRLPVLDVVAEAVESNSVLQHAPFRNIFCLHVLSSTILLFFDCQDTGEFGT